MIDRAKFFAALRARGFDLFGTSLSQGQVDLINAILDKTVGWPRAHVAYALATAYHETGGKRMVPSRENLFYTTAEQIRKTWPSRFPTESSAAPFLRNPAKLANHVYNGRLGNVAGTNDGYNFRGGGADHLTGRENYERFAKICGVDVVANPDLMLRPDLAAHSLAHGLSTGRYRGRKLSDYDRADGFDFVGARAIVNADVKANGALVAGYARKFDSALQSAKTVAAPAPQKAPPSAPKPIAAPAPAPKAQSPWAAIFRGVLAIFSRNTSK